MSFEGIFAVLGPYVISFSFVLCRVGAMMMLTPVLNSQSLPRRVRFAVVAAISLAIMSAIGPAPGVADMHWLSIVAGVATEILAGATMGFAVVLFFSALSVAGQLMGIQMGFAIANLVDPTTLQHSGIIVQILNMLAMLLFLIYDGHLLVLRVLFESFNTLPPGTMSPNSPKVVLELVAMGSEMFVYGLRIAMPVVCVVLLCNVGMAIVARTVPQVNIFAIAFIITIGAGLAVFILSIPFTAEVFDELLRDGVRASMRLTRVL